MKNLPALKVWLKFCDRFKIAESSVPLFEANDLVVATHQIGLKNPRAVLSRSAAMEAMLLGEASKAIDDLKEELER